MKKAFGSLFMLFGILAALLLGGVSGAQATVPPSKCENKGLINIVVCEIDANDNGQIDVGDIKVTVLLGDVLSNNDLDILAIELDDLVDVGDVSVEDVIVIKDTVVNVYDLFDIVLDPDLVIVIPCGCTH